MNKNISWTFHKIEEYRLYDFLIMLKIPLQGKGTFLEESSSVVPLTGTISRGWYIRDRLWGEEGVMKHKLRIKTTWMSQKVKYEPWCF